MAAVVVDAGLTSLPDVSQGSEDHVGVQSSHLPPDVSLELSQGGRPGSVDLALQKAPEEEVEGVEVW